MPPSLIGTRKRAAPPSADAADPAAQTITTTNKRRRTSQESNATNSSARGRLQGRNTQQHQRVADDDDDDTESLFVSDPEDTDLSYLGDTNSNNNHSNGTANDHAGVIDLSTTEEVPKAQLPVPPQEDKTVRLHKFNCAICMDDSTNLSLTHCGHLFCGECLFSAMNVETTRNKCPVCRQKIESKERSAYTTRTKGFWNLKFKLKPKSPNRKGKEPAR